MSKLNVFKFYKSLSFTPGYQLFHHFVGTFLVRLRFNQSDHDPQKLVIWLAKWSDPLIPPSLEEFGPPGAIKYVAHSESNWATAK